jgi:hypothetical protein
MREIIIILRSSLLFLLPPERERERDLLTVSGSAHLQQAAVHRIRQELRCRTRDFTAIKGDAPRIEEEEEEDGWQAGRQAGR